MREKIEGKNEEARKEKNQERPTTDTPNYRRSLHTASLLTETERLHVTSRDSLALDLFPGKQSGSVV